MTDYDSFGPCWLTLDESFSILSTSSSLHTLDWVGQNLWEHVQLKQPTVVNPPPCLDQIYGRILVMLIPSIKLKFRCTLHKVHEDILLLMSPLLGHISEASQVSIPIDMNHPACLSTDLLILKDVIAKGQEKLRTLENKSIKMELEQQKQINKHQSKLASIGELSAGIAHEINNPLTIAMGNLDLCRKELARKNVADESINKYVSKQKRALSRIKTIVDSLRIYARSDDHHDSEDFSLKQVIDDVVDLLKEIYEKEDIQIYTELPEKDFLIHGLSGEFQQVILNLIKNAKDSLKDCETKEITLRIRERPLNQLTVEVQDTGEGIKEAIKDKIFDPFFTSKPIGEGTGLGLGICYDIIASMQGKLYFKSQEGAGCTFFIDLPYISREQSSLS